MKLSGKAAIVTGGGRGIGRAIAVAFAENGADVCVMARSRNQLNEVADQIQQTGRRGIAIACDVCDYDSVRAAMAEAVRHLGRLDILVNNAGGGSVRTAVGDDDPHEWSRVVQLNLTGSYFACRECLAPLRENGGGTIINVGSGMGHQSRAVNSSYNASKAGLWMLTRCLAQQCWGNGITVNELIPGPVATELTAGIFQPQQPHPSVPSEWVKLPEDVTDLAIFLATQGPHGPTGQSFSLARRPLQ